MEELKKYREKIISGLDNLKTLTSIDSEKEALDVLVDFAKRGKLVRGCVILRTAEYFGESMVQRDALKAALAMELTHSGLLIHDDIMDKDRIRRGKKSVHVFFEEREDAHFGQSMAITVADYAFYISMKLLSSISGRVSEAFSKEIANVCVGQMEDLYSGRRDFSREEILEYYRLKTARYTFVLPLMIGAMVAGKDFSSLEKAGDSLGVLFQLRDDYLGVFGNQEKLGKPLGTDLVEGKKTLIMSRLLEKMTVDEKERYFAITDRTEALSFVKGLLEKYGVKSVVEDDIEELKSEASRIISEAPMTDFLQAMLEYILNRDK